MKNIPQKIIIGLGFASLISIAHGSQQKADDKFIYIGGEIGMAEPVKRSFLHETSKTKLTLKHSKIFSGKIGYSYYPQMAIEFSATYQPMYKLGYILPPTMFTPEISDATKVRSDVYMFNLIYDLKEYKSFTPFIILGGGLASIKVKPTITSFMNQEFFRIKKHNSNCLAWQAGLGISKDIIPNFSLDIAAKLQVVHSVKIKYDTLNPLERKFIAASPIKKTLGVIEIGVGFTYKFVR